MLELSSVAVIFLTFTLLVSVSSIAPTYIRVTSFPGTIPFSKSSCAFSQLSKDRVSPSEVSMDISVPVYFTNVPLKEEETASSSASSAF